MGKERIHLLDAVRGLAVLLMVVFHVFFTFGKIFGFPFFQEGYLTARSFASPVISTLFIFSCAYSCLLSKNNLRRGLIILAVALGMSVVTVFLLPLIGINGEGIRFGILHFLAVAVLISPLLLKLVRKIPAYVTIPLFILLAFGTRDLMNDGFFSLPVTDPIQGANLLFPFGIYHGDFYSADYYPLLPWILVFGIGCALAVRFPPDKLPDFCFRKKCPPLEFLGRHALIIYIVHQPVIYGLGLLFQLLFA